MKLEPLLAGLSFGQGPRWHEGKFGRLLRDGDIETKRVEDREPVGRRFRH